jgi:hypothetical protein
MLVIHKTDNVFLLHPALEISNTLVTDQTATNAEPARCHRFQQQTEEDATDQDHNALVPNSTLLMDTHALNAHNIILPPKTTDNVSQLHAEIQAL